MQNLIAMFPRILLSPDGADGNGDGKGGAAGGSNDGAGGAGGQGGAGGDGGDKAPQWVSKADFESFTQGLEQRLSSFAGNRGGRDDDEDRGDRGHNRGGNDDRNKAPEKPDPSKYDFKKDPGALDRYNRDVYRYHRHLDRQEEAEESKKLQAAERLEQTERGHKARVSEYKKAHPEYDADIKAAGIIKVLDEVKRAIYAHRNSAAIVHYLAKNKAAVEELNNAEDVQEVLFKVGEIAASIRAEDDARKKNAEAAGQRPLRFTNRSSLNGGPKSETSKEERFQRFHK